MQCPRRRPRGGLPVRRRVLKETSQSLLGNDDAEKLRDRTRCCCPTSRKARTSRPSYTCPAQRLKVGNFRSDNLSQLRPWKIGTRDPPEGERTEIAGVASTQGLHKQYYPSKARRGVVGVRPPLKVTNIISHQRADNAASTSVGDQVVDAVGATLYSIDW